MKHRKKIKGFTFLELLTVIAILGVLAAMAYPNLIDVSRYDRAKVTSANFVKSFAYARTEAISKNRYISICPLPENENSQGCNLACNAQGILPANSCDWSHGTLVFEDKNRNGQFDTGSDSILQVNRFSTRPVLVYINGQTQYFTWAAGGLSLKSSKGQPNATVTVVPLQIGKATELEKAPDSISQHCSISVSGHLDCNRGKG